MSFAVPFGAPMMAVMPVVNMPVVTNGGDLTARGRLTAGIPEPSEVQRQKETYAKSLEQQLKKGVEVLAATHKQQTDMLHAQANEEKQRYNIALDQQVKQRELELSRQYNEQLMRLQQAAQMQRAELEQQACGLTLEYQQRKVQEEYFSQQEGIEKQHVEAQSKLDSEIQQMMATFPGAEAMLQRVQANVRIGGPLPMATYANPFAAMQPAPLPPMQAAVRPYVPPAAPILPSVLPPQVGGPTLSYVPQQPMSARATLSFTPATQLRPVGSFIPPPGAPASIVAPSVVQRPMASYVPPGQVGLAKS